MSFDHFSPPHKEACQNCGRKVSLKRGGVEEGM